MKVLAVGDIHTKVWIINEVEKVVDNYDAIVFVGDYADDFNRTHQDSINTWIALRALCDKYPGKIKPVLGNHDYIYVNYTKTTQTGYDPLTETILNTDHKDLAAWLRGLPIIEHIDGVMYSHAGVLDAWAERYNGEETSVTLWNDSSPLWVRPDAGFEYRSYQVFGHTPSETCWEVQPNVWCIDTFSTYPNGAQYGDHTVLEITDGTQFKKVKINDNNSTNSKQS